MNEILSMLLVLTLTTQQLENIMFYSPTQCFIELKFNFPLSACIYKQSGNSVDPGQLASGATLFSKHDTSRISMARINC